MGKQQIEFIIRPDGTVTESVSGTVGADCQELTRRIEERLGEVKDREHKPEFYQQQEAHGKQSASTGGNLH